MKLNYKSLCFPSLKTASFIGVKEPKLQLQKLGKMQDVQFFEVLQNTRHESTEIFVFGL